jgi:hypothetical protein
MAAPTSASLPTITSWIVQVSTESMDDEGLGGIKGVCDTREQATLVVNDLVKQHASLLRAPEWVEGADSPDTWVQVLVHTVEREAATGRVLKTTPQAAMTHMLPASN